MRHLTGYCGLFWVSQPHEYLNIAWNNTQHKPVTGYQCWKLDHMKSKQFTIKTEKELRNCNRVLTVSWRNQLQCVCSRSHKYITPTHSVTFTKQRLTPAVERLWKILPARILQKAQLSKIRCTAVHLCLLVKLKPISRKTKRNSDQ
jgi:hypothetical protein